MDTYSARLLGHTHRNPSPPSREFPSASALPWPAQRAVRLAWLRALVAAEGWEGEIAEDRWKRAAAARDSEFWVQAWRRSATEDESADVLRALWPLSYTQQPEQEVGLAVLWYPVGNEALRAWWEREEDARELLHYATPRISRQRLVRLAAACARTALPYVPAEELRPLRAIETAEAWARGESDAETVRTAVNAANDASTVEITASYAANAAASAAYAVANAAYAVDASAYAASASASASAAYAAAYAAALRAMADLIRSMQEFPPW